LSEELKYTHPSDSEWEDLISSCENCYFFHTPAWAKVLEGTYGFKIATRLYEVSGTRILVPLMRKRKFGFNFYISMPMGYGGVFSTSSLTNDVYGRIFKHIIGGRNVSLRISLPPFSDILPRHNLGVRLLKMEGDNYTHILPLEGGFDHIWNHKFEVHTRTAVRKAEKNDIKIVNENSLENFRAYYILLSDSSKKWGYKEPFYPFKLFESLYKYAFDYVQLRLAVKEDVVIAALLSFAYGSNVFYWGSAVVEEYKALNSINLLLKDAIEDACDQGYKYFNFGASGGLDGVSRFKDSFGAEKIEINQYLMLSRLSQVALTALNLKK